MNVYEIINKCFPHLYSLSLMQYSSKLTFVGDNNSLIIICCANHHMDFKQNESYSGGCCSNTVYFRSLILLSLYIHLLCELFFFNHVNV